MKLEILTPDKTIYKGEVISVTVPGTMGSFQVLKGHAPIISTLEDGTVTLNSTKGIETFYIKKGVVEVDNDSIIVLAESSTN